MYPKCTISQRFAIYFYSQLYATTSMDEKESENRIQMTKVSIANFIYVFIDAHTQRTVFLDFPIALRFFGSRSPSDLYSAIALNQLQTSFIYFFIIRLFAD